MQSAKGKAVGALTGGIEYLFKKYGVDYLKGKGSLAGPNTVRFVHHCGGFEVVRK